MTTSRISLVAGLALALLGMPGEVSAQLQSDARIGLKSAARERTDLNLQPMVRRDKARSHWKEGGVITALAAIIAGNVLARDASSGQRLRGTLFAAPVFFVPGALIGAQFPKD